MCARFYAVSDTPWYQGWMGLYFKRVCTRFAERLWFDFGERGRLLHLEPVLVGARQHERTVSEQLLPALENVREHESV